MKTISNEDLSEEKKSQSKES